MSKRGVFVTGTDTGVGKTLISALLLSALREAGKRAGYFKPVQTGRDDDTETVSRLAGLPPSAEPVYRFSRPQAPSRAGLAEGKRIELEEIAQAWERLPEGDWVIEGAGGLLAPLREDRGPCSTRDLIRRLGLPVVIVSSTRLGTLNHTLLTLETARRSGLDVLGVVLNGRDDPGLEKTLRAFDPAPVLSWVPEIRSLSSTSVQQLGPEYFGRFCRGEWRRIS